MGLEEAARQNQPGLFYRRGQQRGWSEGANNNPDVQQQEEPVTVKELFRHAGIFVPARVLFGV